MRLPLLTSLACAVAALCTLNWVQHADARTISFGGGAWSWFADPRAIHHGGQRHQTYLGWVDRRGRVTVGSYDRLGQRTRTVLKNFRRTDDHDNPALLMLPSGRIAAFFTHHSSGFLGYRVSTRPEDVSSFGPRLRMTRNVAGGLGYTYPNPIMLRNEGNVIYLFWRGGSWNPTFSRRFPGGGWRRARTLIQGRPGQRPYVKYASTGKSTIAFAFTNGHPRETQTSVYFAQYRNGFLRGPSGRRISSLRRIPIRLRQASLVHSFHRTGLRAWVHDVALTRSGRPVIAYAVFTNAGRHLYIYAVWTGRGWARHLLTDAGGPITRVPRERFYSGGITLDHDNPRTLFLSRRVGRYHQVEKWHTPDGGRHWSRRRLTRSRTGNFRPIAPRGQHRGEDDVIWMRGRYNRYKRFYTSIFARLKLRSRPPRATFHIRGAGRRLFLDARASRPGSAPIAARRWQFGDGAEDTGSRTSHRYTRPGTYFPRLTVTDARGRRDTLVVEVVLGRRAASD